ncbi:MAG: DsbA family protein [Parvularculaceae bacterium]|nr:DsbA family protein [Parvularculaceae bacterium]
MPSRPLRAVLLAASLLTAACSQASSEAQVGDPAKPAAATPQAGVSEVLKTDMVLGKADAPVTLVEYASVTCPACAAFNTQIIPEVKTKYIDTGKVKLVYREFPTSPANYSIIGSVLARCAAEKSGSEAYFLITDALFRNQQTWVTKEARAELIKIISQAGMDEAALDACVARKELVEIINSNATAASDKYKVTGTPTFFLNGEKMTFRTKEDFDKLIADAVAKAGA